MTFREVASELIRHLPHRAEEWAARDAEIGEYVDADELVGYLLDELVCRSELAQRLADELERLYALADAPAKEVIEIGVFEEMCLRLHVIWDERGRYGEHREVVLGYLGSSAREVFIRYEAELDAARKRSPKSQAQVPMPRA